MRTLTADLVVAGGGTAGCAAAVAAARRGHRVLLVEEMNALGGVSTTGGVSEWFAGLEGMGDIFDEIKAELGNFGARFGRFYNPEYLKVIWQLMAERAGVKVLLHSSVVGASAEEGKIRGAEIASCSRRLELRSPFYVDATGEGDLGYLAGARFEQGDPDTGRTLHMSLTFMLKETEEQVEPYLPDGLDPISDEEGLPGLKANIELPDGRVYCNMTKVMGQDPTQPESLSEAECEARRQLIRILHYLQRTSYPRHVLAASGSRIGIREGRRLIGDYVLTREDILEGAMPEAESNQGIAVATAQIDFHSLTRSGHTGWREAVEPYPIPFSALVVRDLDNLLAAGKCISGDQVAMSSYRMTPTCCGMGQAAGTAVALALEQECSTIRGIDVGELRGELAGSGLELDPRKHDPFAPEVTPDPEDAR